MKEVNQQNLNTNFKFKIEKRGKSPVLKGQGIYAQMVDPNSYKSQKIENLNLSEIKTAILKYYNDAPQKRELTILTNIIGAENLEKALEQLKNKKDEHRKRLSFKSKIFKQTYKFG
jgi:hypothetical protein